MRFGYIDKNLGKTVLSFALVGTLVTCVLAMPKDNGTSSVGRELVKGYYMDEDVKKNRQIVLERINRGGSEDVKTYGKRKNTNSVVPKKIDK